MSHGPLFLFVRFQSGRGKYTAERLAMETRKLQILGTEFNAMFKWILWFFQVVVIGVIVFGICGAVWGEGQRKLHMAISAGGVIVIQTYVFSKVASVFDSSRAVIVEWCRCGGHAWFARFLRSTPLLRVFLGSYFYADTQLVLTSLSIIAQNSVTLLVSRRS